MNHDVKYEQDLTKEILDKNENIFESASEFSFDNVRINYNSDKPTELKSFAYNQGNQAYIGPGNEPHRPHELGHVVQLKMSTVKPAELIQEALDIDGAPE
jgi:hypothetical protein